jgi:DNA-binding LacI/PurR family transcriptional regulator
MAARKSRKPSVADASVTIKDIAEHLGISHSTVSRALSDHPYTNEQTKQNVRQAVERLGYVPNAAARSLRSDKGSLVGLILPQIQNELFGMTAEIVAHRCSKNGFQMMLAASEDDPVAEYNQVLALREARARGIILTPTPGLLEKTAALLQGVPLVQYSRHHPRLAAPSVSVDGERGLLVATQHLLQLGHRRIAYVGMQTDRSTGAERLAGYLKAHDRAGVRKDAALRRLGPSDPDFARAAVSDLLNLADPPTALLLGSNALTVGALRALRDAGLEMPRDLSLIGFGDPSWYALWNPGITTVGTPLVEMAEAASSALMRQLTSLAEVPERGNAHFSIDATFVLRGTTAPPHRLRNRRSARRTHDTRTRRAGSGSRPAP